LLDFLLSGKFFAVFLSPSSSFVITSPSIPFLNSESPGNSCTPLAKRGKKEYIYGSYSL
jgi:hypothetical protein